MNPSSGDSIAVGPRKTPIIVFLWPVCFGLAVLAITLHSPWLLSATLFHDDSYYYVKVASNWASTGSMSLSGFGTTTGFHPLWGFFLGGALRMAHMVLPGDGYSPLAVMVILSTLNATVFVAVNYHSFRLMFGDGVKSIFSGLICFGFCWKYLFDGMESGIVLSLLAVSLYAAIQRKPLLLGIATALLAWARIDALVFASIFYLVYTVNLPLNEIGGSRRADSFIRPVWGLRPAMMMVMPVILSLILRSTLFSSQVSENAKLYWFALDMMRGAEAMLGLGGYLRRTILGLWWGVGAMMDPLIAIYNPSYAYNSDPAGTEIKAALFIVLLAGAFLLVLFRYKKSQVARNRTACFAIAASSVLLAFTYLWVVRFFNIWQLGWHWYLTAPAYAVSVAVIFILVGLSRGGEIPGPRTRNIVSLILILLVTGNIRFLQGVLTPRMGEWRWLYNEMVSALDSLPVKADEAVGTWAAGQIAYFSRHRIVNLEGLVESPAVLKAQFTDDIRPVITSHKIRYIATKSTPEAIRLTTERAISGVPKWKTGIRDRVFKDLEWEPVVVNADSGLRSPFCILKVDPLPRDKPKSEARQQ